MSTNKKATAGKQVAKETQHEVNKFSNQFHRVYKSFFEQPMTMKEADKITGVMRENICWYCRTLRQENRLYPIKKRFCTVTKHRAMEFTTDPAKAPKQDLQLNLF